MGNGRDGTTLFHLKKLAEQLNFDTKSYKADSRQLGTLILPAILYNNLVNDKLDKDWHRYCEHL